MMQFTKTKEVIGSDSCDKRWAGFKFPLSLVIQRAFLFVISVFVISGQTNKKQKTVENLNEVCFSYQKSEKRRRQKVMLCCVSFFLLYSIRAKWNKNQENCKSCPDHLNSLYLCISSPRIEMRPIFMLVLTQEYRKKIWNSKMETKAKGRWKRRKKVTEETLCVPRNKNRRRVWRHEKVEEENSAMFHVKLRSERKKWLLFVSPGFDDGKLWWSLSGRTVENK